MLNRFETVKKEEIKNLRALKARGAFPKPLAMKRPSFRDALVPRDGLPAVIAEYKRASPSRGLICDTISRGRHRLSLRGKWSLSPVHPH